MFKYFQTLQLRVKFETNFQTMLTAHWTIKLHRM